MNKSRKLSLLCAAAVSAVFVFVQSGFAVNVSGGIPNVEEQREVRLISMTHQYDLNPHTANYTSEAQVLSGLYEGLFSYDPLTLEPRNALCVSYKISRTKKRWTFTLREGACFSTGEPITAATVRDSWLRLLATPNAPYSSLLDFIEGARNFRTGKGIKEDVGISVRNDKTLVVHLEEPAEHLPRILCHHAFSIVSSKPNSYSGAFTLKSYKNNTLVLAKNPKYYDAASVKIPGITITLSDDLEENAYQFNTGNADWITEGNALVSKIINSDAIHVAAEFGTYYLFFKMGDSLWSNTEFRNALLEAIPYDALRKNITVPATTLIYPLPDYPSVSGIDDYDSDDAIAMMNKAREHAKIPYDKKLTLKFAITDTDFMKDLASQLKAAWEPLGVELVTETTTMEQYNSLISSWNADLFAYSWIGDFADPLAFLELFRSDSSLNVANYKNETFDEYLLTASRADTSEEHYLYLARAEKLLLDESLIIPIYHPISMHLIDLSSVGGWQTNALDMHPFKYLYIKHQTSSLPNLVRYTK